MPLPNVMNTGRTGMVAAKAAISTTGHNIANANTEGYTRQRVHQEAEVPREGIGRNFVGQGTRISRIDHINDEYLEKQIRNSTRDLSHFEEKDMVLKQTEDIFNEMGGEGINRLMGKFFNSFRQLANDPDNEAVRQAVREASQALVNDFHRLRNEVNEVRGHIDSRLEGYSTEINSLTTQIKDLNQQIKLQKVMGAEPNDLLDKRMLALKQLSAYMDLSMHYEADGGVVVDVKGVGPLVGGPEASTFSVFRTPADAQGKPENSYDIRSTGSAQGQITHQIKGGKLGALLEVRDHSLSTILDRLDELAYNISTSVNEIHAQGFTRNGQQGVAFFNPLVQKERASEMIELSSAVKNNVNHIATAAEPESPSDNRIAIAISGLQNARMMSGGKSTVDDFYNSIVSDVGVAASRNRSSLNQQKDISTQLTKLRDQISGVSIDEETANLLQFQHAFDASAKVIQVADECLKTVLELKR